MITMSHTLCGGTANLPGVNKVVDFPTPQSTRIKSIGEDGRINQLMERKHCDSERTRVCDFWNRAKNMMDEQFLSLPK